MSIAYRVIKFVIENLKTSTTIWWLFFPITYTFELLGKRAIRKILYAQLDEALRCNNGHAILKICSDYIRNENEYSKCRGMLSKQWISYTLNKRAKKLYNYAIVDKDEMSFDYFRTLVGVYVKYNMIGGAVMSTHGGDAVVKIESACLKK